MQFGTIKIKRKCKQAILSTSLQIVQAIIGCMYECAVVNSLGTGLATLCQHWDSQVGAGRQIILRILAWSTPTREH